LDSEYLEHDLGFLLWEISHCKASAFT